MECGDSDGTRQVHHDRDGMRDGPGEPWQWRRDKGYGYFGILG